MNKYLCLIAIAIAVLFSGNIYADGNGKYIDITL